MQREGGKYYFLSELCLGAPRGGVGMDQKDVSPSGLGDAGLQDMHIWRP